MKKHDQQSPSYFPYQLHQFYIAKEARDDVLQRDDRTAIIRYRLFIKPKPTKQLYTFTDNSSPSLFPFSLSLSLSLSLSPPFF